MKENQTLMRPPTVKLTEHSMRQEVSALLMEGQTEPQGVKSSACGNQHSEAKFKPGPPDLVHGKHAVWELGLFLHPNHCHEEIEFYLPSVESSLEF